MSILSEIKALEMKHVALFVTAFLATIAPGFLTIYSFRPELIERYNVFKLALFSFSLTLPLFVLNLAVVDFCNLGDLHDESDMAGEVFLSFLVTSGIFYVSLLLTHLLLFSFRRYVATIAVLELTLLLVSLAGRRSAAKGKT